MSPVAAAPHAESRPLTSEQRAALSARDRSVALAAGAGCGKTFVLTERFIAEVDPTALAGGGELREIVAITFTDAAAREMRDRIRRRCYQRLEAAGDSAESAAWQQLLRAIDSARISTIHAFCTALLRRYAIEAGVDPQFEVLDAAAAELLRLETVDDCLRRWLLERRADALDLAAAEGGLGRLRTDLTRLCQPRFAAAIAKWRDAAPMQVVQAWQDYFEREAAPRAADAVRNDPALARLASLCDPQLAASEKLVGWMADVRDGLVALCAAGFDQMPARAGELRTRLNLRSINANKHWHDPADYQQLKSVKADVCKLLERSCAEPLDMVACQAVAQRGLALTRLAADATAALHEAKQNGRQLEFDDLLLTTLELLQRDDVRHEIAAATRLVMVDEFQDTNPLQLEIVKAVCGPGWQESGLFAVGDFKQSIYRFNGAEPRVSTELRGELPPASRLSLTTNFRSQPAILDFVNAVFAGAFVDYEPLRPSRPQLTAAPSVEFLWTPADADDDQDEADASADEATPDAAPPRRHRSSAEENRRREARRIARRLRELLESPEPLAIDGVGDKSQPRRLQPGDIAILLRSLADVQPYEEALRNEGLEYYLAGGHAFYSQQEIYDVLNLLRAVAGGVDEIALAGALRSPLFSLEDETLFWLVEHGGSLHAAVASVEVPTELSADEAAKVRRAAATLARLRSEKDGLLVAELLSLALELTGYDAVVQCEFLGSRKAANLAKLIEQARALDRRSPGDLSGFITQLAEFVARAPKEALAATQSEGHVIRIMTIHYAKGLEFPLVVLPDLERRRRSASSEATIDERLGPLVRSDESDSNGSRRVGLDLYREAEDEEDVDERKRLFYVACTRAADYLMLSSAIADVHEPKQDWLQLVNRQISLDDGALVGELPAGFTPPLVRVTCQAPRVDESEAGRARGAGLERMVAKTRELAARQQAPALPAEAAPIPVDGRTRRRFSFSRLTGLLAPLPLGVQTADESTNDGALDGHFAADGEAWLTLPSGSGEIEPAPDGRGLGALVHAVLEYVDFREPSSVRPLCHRLATQFAGEHAADNESAAARMVERFLQSTRAAALADAAAVQREVEFMLPWPPIDFLEIAAGAPPSGRYLHGYLDCLYQDASGEWRLIDYKTNRIAAADVRSTAARYELQLLAYSIACAEALGGPLAEVVLVFLHPGVERQFVWTPAERRAGVERLTAAMDAYAAQT